MLGPLIISVNVASRIPTLTTNDTTSPSTMVTVLESMIDVALIAIVDVVSPTARISRNASDLARWIAPLGRSNIGVSQTSSSAV